MKRSLQIFSVVLLLTLASVVSAQTPLTCGIVEVEAPADVDAGVPVVFTAKLAGLNHTTKLEFKWKLSAGTITSGDGTSVITVDTAGVRSTELTATAELLEAPLGCSRSASRTMLVRFACYLPDDYGDIRFEDEKARLDNFAIQLKSDPPAIGYIVMTAGQETFRNETKERLARIKSYLVNVRKIDPKRVVTMDCGFTPDLTIRLWTVSAGASPPECYNSAEIPLSGVKFTKPRPQPAKKKR